MAESAEAIGPLSGRPDPGCVESDRRPTGDDAARRSWRGGREDRASRQRATRCAITAGRRTARACGGRSSAGASSASLSTSAALAGQDIFRQLASEADVVVENFRPGTMARWRIDFAALRAVNPALVMAHVTGFGQSGPLSTLPGFGTIAESMSGFAHRNGPADGPPIAAPVRPRRHCHRHHDGACDHDGPVGAAIKRHRPGDRRFHHRATPDGPGAADHRARSAGPGGAAGRATGPPSMLPGTCTCPGTAAGWPCRRALSRRLTGCSTWSAGRTCSVSRGSPAPPSAPGTPTSWTRSSAAGSARWTIRTCSRHARDAGVPISTVYDVRDIIADPQYAALGAITTVPDPDLGPLRMVSTPFRLSRTPASDPLGRARGWARTTRSSTDGSGSPGTSSGSCASRA